MSVVLRCPSCGTTQGHGGECEACFEGQVRYFCTNHEEGIWLDDPVCSRCGSRFGDAPRKPVTRPATRPSPPATPPDFRAPGSRRAPDRRSASELGEGFTRGREEDAREHDAVPPRRASLEDLLEDFRSGGAAARAGERARYERGLPLPEPSARRVGVPIVGCLIRLIGLGLFLIIAIIFLIFLLFGGLTLS